MNLCDLRLFSTRSQTPLLCPPAAPVATVSLLGPQVLQFQVISTEKFHPHTLEPLSLQWKYGFINPKLALATGACHLAPQELNHTLGPADWNNSPSSCHKWTLQRRIPKGRNVKTRRHSKQEARDSDRHQGTRQRKRRVCKDRNQTELDWRRQGLGRKRHLQQFSSSFCWRTF